MKKKMLTLLASALTAVLVFTGCSDDKSYSYYQIGARFPDGEFIEKIPVADRTEQQKQDLKAMEGLIKWLGTNMYLRNGVWADPLIIEGEDETVNDNEATKFFEAKYNALKDENLDEVMEKIIADNPEYEITGSGTFTMQYVITKGSENPSVMKTQNFTVNY